MRKVYVTVTVDLILQIDDGVEVGTVLEELDINCSSESADVDDFTVTDHEVTDSK